MKPGAKILAVLAASCLLFLLGFSWRDIQSLNAPSTASLKRLIGVQDASASKVSNTKLYELTFNRIVNDYYKKVDKENLKYASLEGLTRSLGDPHTAFLVPKFAEAFELETRGNFVGVGARLAPDPLGARVANVFDGSPAQKAGLKMNDVITAVNGASVSGKEVDSIVKLIRGDEGTVVKLTVLREKLAKPLVLSIRRARITTPTVEARLIPGTKIGYMMITNFAEPTVDQFDKALDTFDKEKIDGLIIDLRGNPGGLLQSAKDTLSRFVDNKVIVTMKERDGIVEKVRTDAGLARKVDYPIVILINEDSASAAEIFAGVMQDYKVAKLVGEHSYGKASVQKPVNFIDKSMLKITIARYYLPRGTDISRRVDEDGVYISGGLQPDYPVELDIDKITTYGDIKTDNQLQKAVEIVKNSRYR